MRDLADRDDRINAVVLLTDGEDTDSTRDARRGRRASSRARATPRPRCACSRSPTPPARGEARKALEQIAEASGGKAYPGDPENIEAVYRSISSFF